jgi:hypothetical protein
VACTTTTWNCLLCGVCMEIITVLELKGKYKVLSWLRIYLKIEKSKLDKIEIWRRRRIIHII